MFGKFRTEPVIKETDLASAQSPGVWEGRIVSANLQKHLAIYHTEYVLAIWVAEVLTVANYPTPN